MSKKVDELDTMLHNETKHKIKSEEIEIEDDMKCNGYDFIRVGHYQFMSSESF